MAPSLGLDFWGVVRIWRSHGFDAQLAEGWNVLLTGRRQDRLERVAQYVPSGGAEAHVAAWDIRDREATDEGVEGIDVPPQGWVRATADCKLRALVNNAGLAVGKGPFDEGLDDDWDRMIDTNVKGLLFWPARVYLICVPAQGW